jgi:hypothetical protein
MFMTEVDTKAAGQASKRAKGGKTPGSGETPMLENPAVEAAKPTRARSAAAAKGKPAEEQESAAPLAETGKSRAKSAPTIAKGAVERVTRQGKPAKAKKPKLVRDSFTMPESEYVAIAALKERCLNMGVAAKKSEILRAAISALARLSDAKVAAAIRGLAAIKTGRPAKGAK